MQFGGTLRQALDQAARRAEESLRQEPDLSGQVHDLLGDRYVALGVFAAAEAEHRKALRDRRAAAGESSLEAAESLVALGRSLHLEVVAEGVEHMQQAEFMAARGCHWVQGFLYGAAISAPEFAEALRKQAGEDIVAA